MTELVFIPRLGRNEFNGVSTEQRRLRREVNGVDEHTTSDGAPFIHCTGEARLEQGHGPTRVDADMGDDFIASIGGPAFPSGEGDQAAIVDCHGIKENDPRGQNCVTDRDIMVAKLLRQGRWGR